MNVQQRVPPGGRDFRAYRMLTLEQRTTREVAEELGISQTRVCQLAARAGAFLAEVVPAVEGADKEKEINFGEQIAAERVQFLYGLAVRSFERSIGEQRTTRQATSGIASSGTVVTTRASAGDTRYLSCAGRLAVLATKLPRPKLMEWMAEGDDEEETIANTTNPPKDDCSAADREQASAASKTSIAEDATSVSTDSSVAILAAAWNELQHNKPTVQLPKSRVEQKLATGQQLSRDDRKARKRLLERKLKESRMAG